MAGDHSYYTDEDAESSSANLIEATGNKLVPEQLTRSYLMMLCACFGGLQIGFSIQFAIGTTHLLALDIPPRLVAVVWLLPPVCGAVLQPCFGFWSDNCHSRWGRRKPYITCGGLALSASLFTFAWSVEVSRGITHFFGSSSCSSTMSVCATAKSLAVFSLLGINVSAQAIQAGARALVVDSCPGDLQPVANAWATRFSNIASVLLYFASSVNLRKVIPALGNTQIESLVVLGSLTLFICLAITCVGIPCEYTHVDSMEKQIPLGPGLCQQLVITIKGLPRQINAVLVVQFFSWLAWYPFLVYISNYVGSSFLVSSKKDIYRSAAEIALQSEKSSRYGSLALLSLSIGALITSTIVPQLLRSSSILMKSTMFMWANPTSSSWITYRNCWIISQMTFAVGISCILLMDSPLAKVLLTGILGFSWAITQWIPFTLLNTAIRHMGDNLDLSPFNGSRGAGLILGIHNMFIATPQILGSLACTFVFGSVTGDSVGNEAHTIAWIFAGCGVVSFVAGILVLRVPKL